MELEFTHLGKTPFSILLMLLTLTPRISAISFWVKL